MSTKERLKAFIKNRGISVATFERQINASNGYVNSMTKGIGYDKTQLIIEKFPMLNLSWLLTGEGEMLMDIDKKHIQAPLKESWLEKYATQLEEENKRLKDELASLRS